jgi:hypothetical protein
MLDKIIEVLGKVIGILWQLLWLLFIVALLEQCTGFIGFAFEMIGQAWGNVKIRFKKGETESIKNEGECVK